MDLEAVLTQGTGTEDRQVIDSSELADYEAQMKKAERLKKASRTARFETPICVYRRAVDTMKQNKLGNYDVGTFTLNSMCFPCNGKDMKCSDYKASKII